MKNMTLDEQMELVVVQGGKTVKAKAAPRRARWWFTQMRSAVDRAMDWKPRPTPPSHQVYMALHRDGPQW
jgi:hypothetical protein